ncbi:MAG TPA: basic amino acid ABC transporter substrate-binding protein [Clostridia bacterium]|nr:basic amino acid ABC transporter substrate-binding protein [Clostridia bacterium]
MKSISKALIITLVLALAGSMAGCAKNVGLKEKGKLIISTNAEFQPFEYMDNNQIIGIDVDISKQIAKDLGVTLQIDNMNFDSVVTAVQTGKTDMAVAGLTKNSDREEAVDFSDPYYDASQVIIVKSTNTAINSENTLKGKKIAVQKGTTGDDLATKLVGDSKMSRFNASTDAITALKGGKVDAVVIDSFPAKIFVKQNSDLKIVGSPLTSEQYCIGIHKGNKNLVDAVNKTLSKMKSSGQLDEIMKKYS